MFFIFFGVLTEEQKNLVEKIFEKHQLQFYHISFKILGSEASANDAVSTAFVKIMDNIKKISQLECPQMTAFCVTIVKNTSIDIIRKSKKITQVESIEYFQDKSEDNVESEVVQKEESQKMSDLLEALTHEERMLIELKYDEELGYKEIGKLFNISEETAKKRGQRIVKKLKAMYGERE